jgi:hypothetical protein
MVWVVMNAWFYVYTAFNFVFCKKQNTKEPRMGFLRTWYLSKKEKLCPLVEFTEET